LSKILSGIEADLAWYFCPTNHVRGWHYETSDEKRVNLTDREICLLEAQDKKTEERIRKELKNDNWIIEKLI